MPRLRVPAGGVVSARRTGCRCRRAAARPPRGGTAWPATHPGLVPSAPAWSRASAGARQNAPTSRPGPASRRRRSARRPGSTAAIASSPARRARASSPAWSPVSQPAACRSQLTSSPRRSAIRSRPSSSASSSPQPRCSGRAGPPPAAHQAPRPAHPGRHRPRAGAPVRVTARPPWPGRGSRSPGAGRGQRPCPFPSGMLQPPGRRETRVRTRRSRRPAPTRPLTVTSPSCWVAFRKPDAVAVPTARLLPAPLTLGPGWLCP